MVELNYKTILGALLLVITTASATYFLENTTEYKSCQGRWELQEDGMYQCTKNLNKQWCYSIESRGSGWYRCYIGKVVNTEPVGDNSMVCNGRVWIYSGSATPYTKIKSGELEAYYGEC